MTLFSNMIMTVLPQAQITAGFAIVCTLFSQTLFAQTSGEADVRQPSVEQQDYLPSAGVLPSTQRWRFGMTISAPGPLRGVDVTIPVPDEWPEQAVANVEIHKPDGIRVAKVRQRDDASELIFKIPRMNAGESATVSVTMDITKHASDPPASPERFQFDTDPPRSMREYLRPSPYIESDDERVQAAADSVPIDPDAPAWTQVETIYDWVRTHVEYEFDTVIRSCPEALAAGKGDCEELSSLFIALCRIKGIPARAVWIPSHTYPEFWLLDEDGEGHWFPCQAAGSRAFGYMPEPKPVLQKGDKFKIRGESGYIRYRQPVIKISDAAASPQVEWIMQPVDSAAGERQ